MRNSARQVSTVGLLATFALVAACSTDTTLVQQPSEVTVSLSQGTVTAMASVALGWAGSLVGQTGVIDPASVDSLVVDVTRVEVLPDSLLGHLQRGWRWGGPRMGGGSARPNGFMGLRDTLRLRDSTMLRDTLGWGGLSDDWYSLDVVGGGHIDLLHLPLETAGGVQLGTGTIPPGIYVHARLFVSSARIYFNTTVSGPGGYTFTPDTAYTVTIPSSDRSGIKTNAGFTVPEGAAEVQLVFDADQTVRHAVATGTGTITIVPVLTGRGRHR
jgi:hypothetical protein